MLVGDVIQLRAHRLDRSGRAVGEHEGVTVLAPGLLPDEIARVELDHIGKRTGQQQRAFGRVVELVSASTHRRSPPCPHHGHCGGCPWMFVEESFVADTKKVLLAQLGMHVDRVVQDERPTGYRWSSKRVVATTEGSVVVGSYQPGSHNLAPMRGCQVDHPDIAACFDELETVSARLGGIDELRYAWAKTNGEGEVLLTLVLRSASTRIHELADALQLPAGVASCVQEADGNAMRGHTVRHLRGLEALTVSLCDVPIQVGPLGFLQPNPPVAALAYPELVGEESGALAFDLYAGAGVTTQLLKKRYAEVRACESWPESAAALGIDPQTAEEFLAAQKDRPDLIIANPPRAGLGPSVCEAIVALALQSEEPMRLSVMSCEPRALARDLERLTENGTFEVLGARAYDTLPQTTHIEVVVWLATRKLDTA